LRAHRLRGRFAPTILPVAARQYRQMEAAVTAPLTAAEQDRAIALTVQRERASLLALIRASIADAAEAEDILQEALYELVVAYRMMQPIERAGAWLARVARNRIIDRFRRRAVRAPSDAGAFPEAVQVGALEELLPAEDEGPEAAAMRALLLDEIERALGELPREQREVFIAHELEGVSFRELAARTGTRLSTLLSRKHYATRFLRERLRAVWDEWLSG
jgi:RNA polymerase sigma factor (sigma-70 family)